MNGEAQTETVFPGYGTLPELGANWRIKFSDADGIPLNMISFEQIDFGAIAFKEIFQNVKTILSTPLYSAVLERLLGIDQSIVDLPLNQASNATIAIMAALYFWEPRCNPVSIVFDSDGISGRLGVNVQLNIRNVIFGTDTPYDRNNIFGTPTVTQTVPPPTEQPPELVPGPVGPPGPRGPRGSYWFQGSGAPGTGRMIRTPPRTIATTTAAPPAQIGVPGPPGPPGATGTRGSEWFSGTTDPVVVQQYDKYLNTVNGDVWEFDGTTWKKV